jgi:streptogramin lyase
VSKIDPATGGVLAIPAGGSWTGAITAGEGALWVTENDRLRVRRLRGSDWTGVVRIDPRSANVSARVAIPGLRAPSTAGTLSPGALAAGERALWAAATATDQVSRIDAETTRVLSTLRGGNEPASVTVGEGAVWVENHNDQNVVRLDPFSNELVATIDVGGATRGIVAGGGAVWVSVVG